MTRRRHRLGWGLGRFIALVIFTIVMTVFGLYQVSSQYDVVRLGYALDDDLFAYRQALESQKRLRLTLSTYRDPTAVRAFAEDVLGMKLPDHRDELVVPDPTDGKLAIAPNKAGGWDE